MSSGDDMSDSSNTMGLSPINSPQYSPLQQVPQLTKRVGVMNFTDTSLHQGSRPYLRIIEQPQDHFRFRYRSEMVGTHGCLLGRSDGTKGKTHPTVELMNYEKRARIRCRLVQNDNDKDHPHQLEDEDDRDVSVEVGDSYIVKREVVGGRQRRRRLAPPLHAKTPPLPHL
ncbi:Nuclear factor NF-kappa-B p110 subunit [Eumeta japonica]|uniref:Nuclear factor NF-kappa-B p110 subunit n=1 Tax=Eumeta variegata TaxID=151549 RepID=A0A4C1XQH1_EUMVA|nr:Nuclear factor NF-kappa-B p110 subunit [Eumeta japonica]